MADVRALLRQQRAARRIEHPHASYSDSGKLACIVCKEPVKTESLWDGHLRSTGHRQRLQALHQKSAKNGSNGHAGFVGQGSQVTGTSHKRKLSEPDEDMPDAEDDNAVPRKRTKPDTTPLDQDMGTPVKKDDTKLANKPITPPLNRRTSGTPTAGVEMQIPSRPATPGPGGTPVATTPRAAPVGRSPLIPDELAAGQQETIRGTRTDTQPAPAPTTTASSTTPATAPAAAAAPVDEDEWAAFEADLLHESKPKPTTTAPGATATPALDSDAVISAPVMTAAEIAAKSEEEERARKQAAVDIQLEDEKEEATRALENEFEVMEELEARARKLRERREALRAQNNNHGSGPGTALPNGEEKPAAIDAATGKENNNTVVAENESEEEEEDDEEEDDWDGFRFRA